MEFKNSPLIANRNATLLICNCVLIVTKFIETKRLRFALQKIGDEPIFFLFTLHWISRYPEWVGGRMESNYVKVFYV